MAKDYAKLSKGASIFWDASSGLKIVNNQVVALNRKQKQSKRVLKGIQKGHIVWAEEEDYNKYLASISTDSEEVKATEPDPVDDFDPTTSTVEELKKHYTAKEMVDLILENNGDLDEDDLPSKKGELAEIILNGYELEEEEDEE